MRSITTYSLQKHHLASKCCSRNAKCCSDNTGKNFHRSSPRSFSSLSEKDKKSFFVVIGKKIRPKMFLWSPGKQFWKHFRKLYAEKNTTNQKLFTFVSEKFPKPYLSTRRMKFWQQCWKVFTRVNWVSAQSPKKMKRKNLFNVFSLKTSIWTRRNLLRKTCQFFLEKLN